MKGATIEVYDLSERPFDDWTDGTKHIIDMIDASHGNLPYRVLHLNEVETKKFIEAISPNSTFFIFASIREIYKLIKRYPTKDIRMVLK